jgi:glutamate dehydrogenase (NAD(P)+)
MVDTFKALSPTEPSPFAAATGKPLSMHGIPGRREATGLGVYNGIAEHLANVEEMRRIGMPPGLAGKRVVIQGLGNVGYHAGHFIQERGSGVVVAVAEREGAVYAKDGLDVDALARHRRETGSVLGFPGVQELGSAEALELECDVLIPAALESVVTAENAPRLRARVVAEAANGPVTPEGEAILLQQGVSIVPDLFLNAGGVTVSYFEWLKNLSHVSFERMTKRYEEMASLRLIEAMEFLAGRALPETQKAVLARGPDEIDFVESALSETMRTAYRKIRALQEERGLPDLRTACWVYATERIATAYLAHGIFP